MKDRFAAVAVGQYYSEEAKEGDPKPAGQQICRSRPGTNGWMVCPVDMSCVDGSGQANDRFLGRNRFLWDFCTYEGWAGGDALAMTPMTSVLTA